MKNSGASPIVIDLFAGAGGMSYGFKLAGFTPVLAIDNNKICVDCLRENHPESISIEADIRNLNGNDILESLKLKPGQVDVVCGGPPCQGFSLIGLRDKNDPRSGLIFEFHRIVNEIQPKFFVMENVPGMLSANKGNFVKKLIELFENDGYEIVKPIKVLSADHFGVPQNRKRVFILGVRKDLAPCNLQYPTATHVSPRDLLTQFQEAIPAISDRLTPTVKDAISDLPNVDKYEHLIEDDIVRYETEPMTDYQKIMRGYVRNNSFNLTPPNNWNRELCTGCRRTVHGPVLTKRFSETPQGTTAPISRLFKLSWDDVANTLRAGTPRERGAYSSPRPIHPFYPRVLTVREGARIQSFPDWYRFHPTKWHGFMQVGNAVPPLLARAVACEILKLL